MLRVWNNWFHCTCNTYGVWLPGDARGWDTRRHRTDIANALSQHTTRFQELPSRPVVRLSLELRQSVLDEFVHKLQQNDIEVIIASLDDHHLHGLARIRDHQWRHWLGLSKKHTSHWLRQNGHSLPGGIWGKRSRAEPILSRQHQLNTYRYILSHQSHGAAIWRNQRSDTSRLNGEAHDFDLRL